MFDFDICTDGNKTTLAICTFVVHVKFLITVFISFKENSVNWSMLVLTTYLTYKFLKRRYNNIWLSFSRLQSDKVLCCMLFHVPESAQQ